MLHRSARADVRRTCFPVVLSGFVPTPLPARPSLLRAYHRSARADVRRTWHHVGWRGSVPTPLPARPSLLRAHHHSARADVRRTCFPVVLSGFVPTPLPARPSLLRAYPPLRSGRRSSDSLRGPSTHSARTAAGGLPRSDPRSCVHTHHSARADVRRTVCGDRRLIQLGQPQADYPRSDPRACVHTTAPLGPTFVGQFAGTVDSFSSDSRRRTTRAQSLAPGGVPPLRPGRRSDMALLCVWA